MRHCPGGAGKHGSATQAAPAAAAPAAAVQANCNSSRTGSGGSRIRPHNTKGRTSVRGLTRRMLSRQSTLRYCTPPPQGRLHWPHSVGTHAAKTNAWAAAGCTAQSAASSTTRSIGTRLANRLGIDEGKACRGGEFGARLRWQAPERRARRGRGVGGGERPGTDRESARRPAGRIALAAAGWLRGSGWGGARCFALTGFSGCQRAGGGSCTGCSARASGTRHAAAGS